MKRTILLLLIIIFAVSFAFGHDEFPPDWRGEDGSMWAEWHTWDGYPLDIPADNKFIPAGIADPVAQAANFISKRTDFEDGYNDGTYYGMQTDVLGIWNEWGPSFEFDNFDQENPIKKIRVQITWLNHEDFAIPDQIRVFRSGYPIPDGTEPENFVNLLPVENKILDLPWSQDGQNYWNVSAFDIVLEDNPPLETIQIGASQGGPEKWWNVAQVVIDTQCTTPEPLTIAFLSIGGLLIRKRS